MSLLNNIEHLAITDGIISVAVRVAKRQYSGDEAWHKILDKAIDTFTLTDEPSIRMAIGKHTVIVQKEGDETIGVVILTGHAIAKSLRRMIRRMHRRDREPLLSIAEANRFLPKRDYAAESGTSDRARPRHSTVNWIAWGDKLDKARSLLITHLATRGPTSKSMCDSLLLESEFGLANLDEATALASAALAELSTESLVELFDRDDGLKMAKLATTNSGNG